MKICAFPSCGKTSLSLFSPPNDKELREKWVEFVLEVNKDFQDSHLFFLCEIHFHSSQIFIGTSRKKLKKGSFPTLYGVSFKHIFISILL